MSSLGKRFAQELLIGQLHRRILVGESQFCCTVDAVQSLASFFCQFGSIVDRLSAATCTSARACHDLYEIVFHFALLQSGQQFSRVAQSAGNRHLDCNAFDFKDGFFPALNASYLLKGIRLRVLARQQEVSRTQRRLHNTAGRTEYDAGSGRFAKEIIKRSFFQLVSLDTIRIDQSSHFSGRQYQIHVFARISIIDFFYITFIFLRRTRHDGNRIDLFRIHAQLLCDICLAHGTEHLLRRFCSRKILCKFREFVLHETNPARAA